MDFNRLARYPFLWKCLRVPLNLIPKNACVFILQGKLKGQKWIAGSSSHDCWIGCYEYEKARLFEQMVKPGNVVFDIGANVGYYSLLAATLVGNDGKVFSFEPSSRNIFFLKEHIRINRYQNIELFKAAVAEKNGETFFDEGPNSSMGKISSKGDLIVRMVTLDELFLQEQISVPNVIKIDVEGAEYLVLCGAKRLLKENSPIIFLATHGSEVHKQCCSLLQSWGYSLSSIDSSSLEHSREIVATKNM